MLFLKNGFKVSLVSLLIILLALSGCSSMPWSKKSDDEDLFFEEDFGKEFKTEGKEPPAGQSKEEDFFKDDPNIPPSKTGPQSKAEAVPSAPDEEDFFFQEDAAQPAPKSAPVEASPPRTVKAVQPERGVVSKGGGFVSTDQKTDREELKADVMALHTQQEELMFRVQELQKIVSNLEPRLAATQERVETSLKAGPGAPLAQQDIQSLKVEIARLKDEIASLRKGPAPSKQAKMVRKIRPLRRVEEPKSTPREYDQALAAYQAGKYDESILMFQELSLKNPPRDLRDNIHFWIGSNYMKLEMYDDAIKQFQTVLKQYPSGNKIHDSRFMLGVCYQKKGDTGRALDTLEAALKGNPPSTVRQKIEKHLMEIK